MIPYSIFVDLQELKPQITETLYDWLVKTISALATLGKLKEEDDVAVSRDIDGAGIQWTWKHVYCFLIEVDPADEVAELNGCYCVCHPVSQEDRTIQSEVATTLEEFLTLIQRLV